MIQLRSLLGRPIVVHRPLVDIAGSITYAAFLGQCLYWTDNPSAIQRGGWFYKTQAEWTAETGLHRTEQENARKRLVSLGLLEERREGMPAKLWYRVNLDALEAALHEYAVQYAGNLQSSMQEPAHKSAGNPQSYNTGEDLQENTPAEDEPPVPPTRALAPVQAVLPSGQPVVLRVGTDGAKRWLFMGRKPPTTKGSQAPDSVTATDAALAWAIGQGWRAGLAELQRSADTCLRYYQGTGKRMAAWEPVVDNWVIRDIDEGKDIAMAQRDTGPRPDSGHRGYENGPAGRPQPGAARAGYGFDANGQPTNRTAAIRASTEELARRQRAREVADGSGNDTATFGADDRGVG
jgi:hypothetical protein